MIANKRIQANIEKVLRTKYDKLRVIDRLNERNNSNQILYLCECDCGKQIKVPACSLTTGNTTSCGCNRRKAQHKTWCGCGEIHGVVFNHIKHHAINRNIKFDLTIEYIWELFKQQNGKCALSGLDIKFSEVINSSERKNRTASLDRINSLQGYIEGNVQWVHKDINIMKGQLTEAKFLEYCKLISQYKGTNH